MADPHNNPLTVEAMDLPGARRILPDPPDTGEAMRIGEEKESSCCGETTGCSGVGEGSTEVTPSSLDCTMPLDDSQDCASARSTTVKDNAAHGSAPPAPEGEGAPTGTAAAESEGAHVAPAAPESEDVPAGTAAAAPPVGEGAPAPPSPESEGTPTAPAAPVGEGAPAATAAPESEDAPAGTESEGAVAVAAPPVGEVVPAPAAPEGEGAPPAPESEGAPAATAAVAESEGAPAAPAAPVGVGATASIEIQVGPCEGAASGVTSAPRLVGDECKRDWLKAIEAKDCLALLDILGKDYDKASFVKLCTETRVEGRTALHVAAMQGCFRLAKQLIDLVRAKKYRDCNKVYVVTSRDGMIRDRYVSDQAAGDFIYGKDGRSGLSAFEMANDIIGNTSISQYILHSHYTFPMYEAYKSTEWHIALSEGNCDRLHELLLWNSRFVLEICSGVSVLDVAIMKSDEELVKQVMRLFCWESADTDPELRWHETSYYPWKIRWSDIADYFRRVISANRFYPGATRRKKMQHARSTRELAEKFGTSDAIKQLLRNVKEHVRGPKKGESDEDKLNGNQELLRSLFERNLFENGVASKENEDRVRRVPLESELPEFSSLIDTVTEIERHWNHEWTKDFLADVDYNFEDKRSLRFSLLRVHYACKHPCQCSTFLNQILRVGTYDWKRLVALTCDGQGRTPFHTMVDFYKPSDFNFHELAIDAVCDSRGRTPMIRAITKQFLEQDNMVFSHSLRHCEEKATDVFNSRPLVHGELKEHFRKNSISMLQGLYLASFLYEDSNVLRLFSSEGEDMNVFKAALSPNHLDSSLHGVPLQNRALFIAATIGNQTLLREWFKFKSDCMVEDPRGRTALHYAVGSIDTSIILPTPFFCSIGYPKKMEERLMKRHNSSVELDINGIPKSNVSVGRKACILMLLQAGVDLSQVDKEGNIPDPITSSNIEFLGWWYDLLAKDSEDKKNSFNQAGNALSVVGTLVAATSYIGPLQPPLSYSHDGYVDSSRSLVKIFMCTNTLAFYLAVASVMFAVVPSLPMPQEGVIDELRRARHTVSSSLFLLLASIVCILVSFAAATAVVIKNGDYYEANDFLLSPSVIGWFFCGIAMVSFFIRVMRLVFYKNPTIRKIYKFSFSALLKEILKRNGWRVQSACRRMIGVPVLLVLVTVHYLLYGLIMVIVDINDLVRSCLRYDYIERVELPEFLVPEDITESMMGSFCMRLSNWVYED